MSTRWVRAMVPLLSRRDLLNVASVDVHLSVGRGCASLLVHSAVMRLVVCGRECGCRGASVQLPRPVSGPCHGAAHVSTCLVRYCHDQRLYVRRTLMVVHARSELAPPDDSCTLLVDLVSSFLPEHTDLSVTSTLR